MADDIFSLTECSVCMSTFEDPRMLTCGHSFCFNCLQHISKQAVNQLHCPQCRSLHLDFTTVDRIPKNIDMRNLVEGVYKLLGNSASAAVTITREIQADDSACERNVGDDCHLDEVEHDEPTPTSPSSTSFGRRFAESVHDSLNRMKGAHAHFHEKLSRSLDDIRTRHRSSVKQHLRRSSQSSARSDAQFKVVNMTVNSRRKSFVTNKDKIIALAKAAVRKSTTVPDLPVTMVGALQREYPAYDWHAWTQVESSALTCMRPNMEVALSNGMTIAIKCVERRDLTRFNDVDADVLGFLRATASKHKLASNPALCVAIDAGRIFGGSWMCVGSQNGTLMVACSDTARSVYTHCQDALEFALWRCA